MEKSLNILRALVAVLKSGHIFVDTFAIERRDSVPSSGIWMVLVTFNPSSLVTVNAMRLPRLDHKKSHSFHLGYRLQEHWHRMPLEGM